jgi:hypothetical protein
MKTFTYQFQIEHEEYSPKNCKKVFGSEESCNPDYPDDVFATEKVMEIFQDALKHCLRVEMKFISELDPDESEWKDGEKRFMKYIRAKQDFIEKVRDSVKTV